MTEDVRNRLLNIKESLPQGTVLVAVSKFHPAESILAAYEAGQRDFGESRAQELVAKHSALPADIQWHFIGHLQQNKVKHVVPSVSLIHSVDNLKLLQEIDKQAARCGRIIPCLLQLHVAQEETKFGFTPEECRSMLEAGNWKACHHVQISGIMCMASNTDNQEQVGKEFQTAYHFFEEAKNEFFKNDTSFHIRSWGMSHDYQIALAEGSNMVRIGTAIFGERTY